MKLLNQYPNIQKEMDIVQELLIKTVQSRQPLVKKNSGRSHFFQGQTTKAFAGDTVSNVREVRQ